MLQSEIAVMAAHVVAQYKVMTLANDEVTTEELDTMARPLLDALTEQLGLQASHVEWQGVYEFELVPIFDYHEVTGKHFAYNVNLDGSINSFNI